MIVSREECEKQFSLALSRYVGYTTGAYNIIDRIKFLLPEFDTKPYILEIELTTKLQKKFSIKPNYALGVINFVTGLGFLNRFEQAGGTARYVLTDFGRTFRAAIARNEDNFIEFLFTYSVLEFDCDVYGLLLDLAFKKGLPTGDELHSTFLERTKQLREERLKWLTSKFPNPILRERIEKNILWIKSKGPNKSEKIDPSKDFARHHASPRKGWAHDLGHLDKKGFLTNKGEKILKKIRGDNDHYFWIAPQKCCFAKLKLEDEINHHTYGPAWNILRGEQNGKAYLATFIEEVSDFMTDSYRFLKLSKMNQVSVDSILPYFYFLENKYNYKLNEEEFFNTLFFQKRDLFAPMSSRSNLLGHYQLRRRKI